MDSYLKFYILKPIQDSEQNLFFSSTMSHAPSTKKLDMAVLFFLGWLCLFYPLKPIIGKTYRVSHKKLLAQCCWSSISSNRHPSLLAILTRLGPEIIFWQFFTRTQRDQALPSHVHGKILPHSIHFWLGFLGYSSILLIVFFLDCICHYPHVNFCNGCIFLHLNSVILHTHCVLKPKVRK